MGHAFPKQVIMNCLEQLGKIRGVSLDELRVRSRQRFAKFSDRLLCGRATRLLSLKDFHRDVVVRLACVGRLRFEEIWIDGACRASFYGIGRSERYCFYLSEHGQVVGAAGLHTRHRRCWGD